MKLIRRVLQLRAAAVELSAQRAAAVELSAQRSAALTRVAQLSTQSRAMSLVSPSSSQRSRRALDGVVVRPQAAARTSLFSTQTAASAADAVETLKTLCNALRNDVRAAPPADELLASWGEQVARLMSAQPGDAALEDEIRRAYESGVAIATKQRQSSLAQALVDQLQGFGVAPSAATFQFLIRGVALDLLARPESSVEDLRELTKRLGDVWEREMLALVRVEENPHYRKTPKERALLRQRLVDGIEAQLDAYERAHQRSERKHEPVSPLPFNEALRTYADNGVPFPRMLELMVRRALLPDVDTYAALLQGARWTEIPATVSQLLQSGVVDELSAPAADPGAAERQSHYVRLLWANAMKAVLHSFSDRFSDRAALVDKAALDELQRVFVFVDKQLSRAFPKFQFATREHRDEVFALRAKAAATCGLRSNALKVLDEYVALAPAGSGQPPLSKHVFLCALELFTWSQLEILHLSRDEVRARSMRRDVSHSRRVAELERVYERVLKHSSQRRQHQQPKGKPQQAEGDADSAETKARLSRDAVELGQRVKQARELKSYQLLVQELLERADGSVDAVLDRLAAATGADASGSDVDVALKLMEQYMTCATRYAARLGDRRQDVAPQVLRRVYRVIKDATASRASGELSAEERDKLHELFQRAIRTAVLFWRVDDVDKLVRKKKRVLGREPLGVRESELLIFQRVATRDIAGAYALLEEVHNAGQAPSKNALHSIVLGVMHKLQRFPNGQAAGRSDSSADRGSSTDEHAEPNEQHAEPNEQGEREAESEPEDLESEVCDALEQSDAFTIEDELQFGADLEFDDDDDADDDAQRLTRMTGADAPASLVDVVSFLQDWYNLHRVRPAAKTVVPVLAQLLATRDLFEFRRLLQILEAMDGGLTPATTVWLEKRLALIGRSIDDFRLHPKAR